NERRVFFVFLRRCRLFFFRLFFLRLFFDFFDLFDLFDLLFDLLLRRLRQLLSPRRRRELRPLRAPHQQPDGDDDHGEHRDQGNRPRIHHVAPIIRATRYVAETVRSTPRARDGRRTRPPSPCRSPPHREARRRSTSPRRSW